MAKSIRLKPKNITRCEAIEIVKNGLQDPIIHPRTKLMAIRKATETEMYNPLTRLELIDAIQYIFEHYNFPEEPQ